MQGIRPVLQCIPSPIEKMLYQGGKEFLRPFFDIWSPHLIVTLSLTSFPIASIIRGYLYIRWNVTALLKHWVNDIDRLLSFMDSTDTIICGPVVSQFFARQKGPSPNLDICVKHEAFGHLKELLRGQAYRHRLTAVFTSTFEPTSRYQVQSFVFHSRLNSEISITVHVVHSDPLRFLISCATSKHSSRTSSAP